MENLTFLILPSVRSNAELFYDRLNLITHSQVYFVLSYVNQFVVQDNLKTHENLICDVDIMANWKQLPSIEIVYVLL
jgi:hypothetical protein